MTTEEMFALLTLIGRVQSLNQRYEAEIGTLKNQVAGLRAELDQVKAANADAG